MRCGFKFDSSLLPFASFEWLPGNIDDSFVLVLGATSPVAALVNGGIMVDDGTGLFVVAYLLLEYQYGARDY